MSRARLGKHGRAENISPGHSCVLAAALLGVWSDWLPGGTPRVGVCAAPLPLWVAEDGDELLQTSRSGNGEGGVTPRQGLAAVGLFAQEADWTGSWSRPGQRRGAAGLRLRKPADHGLEWERMESDRTPGVLRHSGSAADVLLLATAPLGGAGIDHWFC